MLRRGFLQAAASIICCSIAGAAAQPQDLTLEEARLKLTGGASKEWVLLRVENHMGSEAECRQGETYTFHANNTVTHKLCTDRHWVETSESWSLNDIDDLDRELVIGEQRYLLLLRDDEEEQQALLRTRSGEKAVASEDKILRHTID